MSDAGTAAAMYARECSNLREQVKEQQAEIDRLREALTKLVRLKKYKDKHGKTGDYLRDQPIAWKQAQSALEDE
jgi:hypothetical protein